MNNNQLTTTLQVDWNLLFGSMITFVFVVGMIRIVSRELLTEHSEGGHVLSSNPKRVTFDRGDLSSAIDAARRLKSDKDLYIVPTAYGLSIERVKPPTWLRHIVVKPDGTIEEVARELLTEHHSNPETYQALGGLQIVKAFKQVSRHGEDQISVSLQAWAIFPGGRKPHFITMYRSGDEYIISPLYAHVKEWIHVPVVKVKAWIKSLPVRHFEPMSVAPQHREDAEELAKQVDEPMAIISLTTTGHHSSLSKTEIWNLTDTDMPYYNDLMKDPYYFRRAKGVEGKIIYISPVEYMRMAAEVHGVTPDKEYLMVEDRLVKEYAERMREGYKFPLPVVDFAAKTQEGRNRVMAAESLGEKEVPVLIVRRIGEK